MATKIADFDGAPRWYSWLAQPRYQPGSTALEDIASDGDAVAEGVIFGLAAGTIYQIGLGWMSARLISLDDAGDRIAARQ
ncbi:hypothetical protein O974_26445 [Mycobacterium avium 11-0986]|nr:hypothetical protein O974_26445 [Mycobacterium avium 11-0986]